VRRPLVVAHRCGSGVAPENTLVALRTALRGGADAVEVDVVPSRDGHPVVHHDDRLSRTAGVDRAVWDLDLAELRRLDVGRWFAPAFEGERLPSLEDVVAALPSGVGLVADFKHGEDRFPGLAARVAEIVRPLRNRFAALSIQHAFALDLAARVPGALALLTFRRPPATDEEVSQVRQLPPGAGLATAMRALSAAVLVAAAETSRPVYVFTPNRPAELRVALSVGADAVITDHVAIAVELRRQIETPYNLPHVSND
jgi:glycerophosphoryl diester phosphodiesterase